MTISQATLFGMLVVQVADRTPLQILALLCDEHRRAYADAAATFSMSAPHGMLKP